MRTCGYCKLICYDILHITHITAVYSRTCLLYRKYLLFTSCGIIWHHLPEAMLITVSWKGFMYMSITEHMFNAMRRRCSHAAKRLPGTTFSRKRQNSCSCRRTIGDPSSWKDLSSWRDIGDHSIHPSIHLLIYLSTYMRSQTVALSQMDVWKKLPKLEVAERRRCYKWPLSLVLFSNITNRYQYIVDNYRQLV